jgi:hypothetical protein
MMMARSLNMGFAWDVYRSGVVCFRADHVQYIQLLSRNTTHLGSLLQQDTVHIITVFNA